MDMNKKLSALKRFECLSESMCSPSTLSFLPDVRCSLDFDQYDENKDNPEIPSPLSMRNQCKRKRNEAIVDDMEDESHESPAKMQKMVQRIPDNNKELNNIDNDASLPTVQGYHSDLKYITTETLHATISGEQTCEKNIIIVDCRYPYEYEGGHIKGSMNLYTREQITKQFISAQNVHNSILLFHCEFSSERAPKLCRYLREQDRSVHSDCYPQLYYPEMYVLHGGYKSFFQQCSQTNTVSDLCEPQQYRPMIHPAFNTQLKEYRKETKKWKRSKSWSGRRSEKMTNVNTTLCFDL